ncbi:MAG: DUF177 domain-containing protein [Methylophaga sp.]|nr:DUF177 domain-containing protein [Methylophaga sp.]
MHQKLPKEIDPLRLAQNGLKLAGQLAVTEMPRLLQSLVSNEGIVDVDIAFDVDEVHTPFMRGEFTTTISMTCERCMKEMKVDLDVHCLLAMVTNERKIEGLAEQYDPWLLENSDDVLLSSVIEDELILALPLVPRHDEACLPASEWSSADEMAEEIEEKVSPFAVLATLKTKK